MPYTETGRRSYTTELDAAEVVWLLLVTIGGQDYRWSTRPIVVDDVNGDGIPFDGGLDDQDVERALATLGEFPRQPVASFAVRFPSPGVAYLMSIGADLSAATGELSRLVVGNTWEARDPVVRGSLERPSYGSVDEPVTFTIREQGTDDTALWPPDAATLSIVTSATAAERHEGMPYPTVFGTPGLITGGDGARTYLPGSPALGISTTDNATRQRVSELVIAGHRVAATSVLIWSQDFDNEWVYTAFTVAHKKDAVGRLIAYVDLMEEDSSTIALTTVTGHTGIHEATHYYVTWNNGGGFLAVRNNRPDRPAAVIANEDTGEEGDGTQVVWNLQIPGSPITPGSVTIRWTETSDRSMTDDGAGGFTGHGTPGSSSIDYNTGSVVLNTTSNTPDNGTGITWDYTLDAGGQQCAKGAGDIIEWWLDQSSLNLDYTAWACVMPALNLFKFGGYADEQVTPWDFIEGNFLPLLPVSLFMGTDGLYPVVWRYGVTDRVAVLSMTTEPGVVRDANVSHVRDSSEVANTLTLEWGIDDQSGTAHRRATVTPGPEDDEMGSIYAEGSWLTYGRKVAAETIETDIVWDEATADLTVSWKVHEQGYTHRKAAFVVDLEDAWAPEGSSITWTDGDIYLSERSTLVQRVNLTDRGRDRYTLQILDDPAREKNTTGPSPTGPTFDQEYSGT